MDREEIDKVVLAYLNKRGFKQAGLAFQQEKQQSGSKSSDASQIDPDIAKQFLSSEVDSKLRSWAYSSLDQYQVLSMNISCCENCPRVLKKKLLKMPGVDSVAIDTENDLVYVVGKIDATTLVNNVAKLGKAVELLSDKKQQPRNHVDQKHKNHTRNEGRGNNFTAPEKGKQHKHCRFEDGRHNSEKKVEEKQEHKCEAYVPPTIDPRVCRDFYCKTHPRGRLIVDRVPAESTGTFFGMGGLPFYSGYSPYGGGSYQYPGGHGGWYGQEPSQYGYGWPPQRSRNLPQHPFIFQ